MYILEWLIYIVIYYKYWSKHSIQAQLMILEKYMVLR